MMDTPNPIKYLWPGSVYVEPEHFSYNPEDEGKTWEIGFNIAKEKNKERWRPVTLDNDDFFSLPWYWGMVEFFLGRHAPNLAVVADDYRFARFLQEYRQHHPSPCPRTVRLTATESGKSASMSAQFHLL